MTPEQQAAWDAWLATMRNGWRFDASPPSGAIEPLVPAVDAELRDLRAALAASQAREVTLRETLRNVQGWLKVPGFLQLSGQRWAEFCKLNGRVNSALADPSPASDAPGRVARAAVAYRKERDVCPDFEVTRALIAADVALKAAVDALLAVAPRWGEPRGGG